MNYLLVSSGLLLHILLWGAGLALLVTPRRWRRLWPLWIAPCGVALQSAVVWLGAHTTLPGTDAYARWTLWLPLLLLALGLRRHGVRTAGRDGARFTGLAVIMAGCLVLLTLPLARTSKMLTTLSLGSCDAADYAAGARVLQEFASDDRSGFIGLTEVVRVASADNFFDFWLRLNHFTPSALMAFNGSVFGLVPHQVTGLLTAVFLVLTLPLVWLLARSTAGFSPVASGWLTLLYGISPISWYAVYQVAPGQILAAQAIALVTWAAITCWREPATWRRGLAYAGLLTVGFGIIWGAYNFIVIGCLVPAATCVGGWALHAGKFARLVRWMLWLLVPLLASGLFFAGRVAGLVERFMLFQQYDFGWKIPPLMPEGWLGIVNGADLRALAGPGAWALSALVLLLLAGAWFLSMRHRGRSAWQVFALLLPVMAGYAYLQWRGLRYGSNASYDAYKLFSVFHPVLLVALCHWLGWLRKRSLLLRGLAVAMMVIVTGLNLRGAYRIAQKVEAAELIVDRQLLAVQAVENRAEVHAVNIHVDEFWARLWANALMLRKPQYFPTHSYEGRLNTPLRGEWDLNGDLLQVKLPGTDTLALNPRFWLVRLGSPYFLRARLGEGWYERERLRGPNPRQWNWSRGEATIELENPHARPLRAKLHFTARSLTRQEVQIWVGDRQQGSIRVGPDLRTVASRGFMVPPGRTVVRLRPSLPPMRASARDPRLLGFAAYAIVVNVQPDAGLPESAR